MAVCKVTLVEELANPYQPVTLNSEMDFYLRNGRNGDFLFLRNKVTKLNFIYYLEKYFV